MELYKKIIFEIISDFKISDFNEIIFIQEKKMSIPKKMVSKNVCVPSGIQTKKLNKNIIVYLFIHS